MNNFSSEQSNLKLKWTFLTSIFLILLGENSLSSQLPNNIFFYSRSLRLPSSVVKVACGLLNDSYLYLATIDMEPAALSCACLEVSMEAVRLVVDKSSQVVQVRLPSVPPSWWLVLGLDDEGVKRAIHHIAHTVLRTTTIA
jgi:hypothetical protein